MNYEITPSGRPIPPGEFHFFGQQFLAPNPNLNPALNLILITGATKDIMSRIKIKIRRSCPKK